MNVFLLKPSERALDRGGLGAEDYGTKPIQAMKKILGSWTGAAILGL